MKVEQFTNDKGRPVANHFVITDDNGTRYLKSYNSIIVKIENGKITLGKNWKYSVTTSKYRSQFLRETTKQTQAKLDSGEYVYDENL